MSGKRARLTRVRWRAVHFHLLTAPDMAEVQALHPGEGVDVVTLDHNQETGQTVVVIEVPDALSPEDAINRAAAHLRAVLPSLADAQFDEEGIKVEVRDPA